MTEPTRLPAVPSLTEVPRDNAVATAELAADTLAQVKEWAPRAVAALDWDAASTIRGATARFADLVATRGLSAAATLDAQEAARRAERVLGQVVAQAHAQSLLKAVGLSPLAVLGNAGGRCSQLAGEVTDEQFEAAVFKARDRGTLSFESLAREIGVDTLSEVERERKEAMARLAGEDWTTPQIAAELNLTVPRAWELLRSYGIDVPADATRADVDARDAVARALAATRQAAEALVEVERGDLDQFTPEEARDLAGRLWTAVVPIVHMRKSLLERGR
jgi:hypothetical protein